MSDDLERRVRDALRDAQLPTAPDSLRDALRAVPASPAAQAPRRWRGPALAAAAILVVAVVGLGGAFAVLRSGPPAGPTGTPGPTAGPTAPPVPPAGVKLLNAAELADAIARQRAGGLEPQVVVADVGIDESRRTAPYERECDPVGTCTVIGTLFELGDLEGTVTVRSEERVLAIPMDPDTLLGPVALRLAGTAPIEFLGRVDLTRDAGGRVDVAGLRDLTAATPDGRIVAVDGWLAGVNGPSCGPAFPTPPPKPFDCPGLRAFLADEPVRPAKPEGENGTVLSVPDTAVQVQYGAYRQFAAAPVSPGVGGNDEPRHGLYLVRMVVADVEGCPACRGWLVVGRLDAQPAAITGPTASGVVHVQSAAEVDAALASDRAALAGRVVFVDGAVSPGTASNCGIDATTCDLGTLDGTSLAVTASGPTVAQLLPDTDYPVQGVMAFRVGERTLEYLGWMGWFDPLGYEAAVADLMTPDQLARGPEMVAVKGWLVAGLPIPCPAPPGPAAIIDTPFQTCPPAWITADEVQPIVRTSNSISYTEPAVGFHVQYGAYGDYAPDPGSDPLSGLVEPRFGTYLVRLLTNPNDANQRGWQVVARLDPPPDVVAPVATPAPEPTPTPEPTPAPTPTAPPTTPVPTLPADLGREAVAQQDGIKVTITLERNPLPAGVPTMVTATVQNLGETTLHWFSDGCETLVSVRGSMDGAPWRLGADQDGVAGAFKGEALGTYGNYPLEPPQLRFRPPDMLVSGSYGCGDIGITHDIKPGKTKTATYAWDGQAYSRWGSPTSGPVTLTGTFDGYWRGDGEMPEYDTLGQITLTLDSWVIGGAGPEDLSPPAVIDAALADAVFTGYLETIGAEGLGSGHSAFARYRTETGRWEVGVITWSDAGNTIRLVEVDRRTGAILGSADRPWNEDTDGVP